MKISYSQIKAWRQCRRLHFYKYVERLEPRRPPLPLFRGSIIHEMLEANINGIPWSTVLEKYERQYRLLFAEEQEEYGDLINDLKRIMEGYFRRWKDDQLEYLSPNNSNQKAEHKFEVELMDGIILSGKIDAVARRKSDGTVWIVEHKSHENIPSDEARFSDLQTVIYSWVAPKIGFPKPDGILWDYLRTKPPSIPRVLRSGELSMAKNIDTDYDTYLRTIKKNGLDPRHYQDILNRLKARGDIFYRRVYFPLQNTKVVKQLLNDLKKTALEISILKDEKTRNISRHCSWCPFHSLCQAELRMLDSSFVRKAEYKVRKDDASEDEAKEDNE